MRGITKGFTIQYLGKNIFYMENFPLYSVKYGVGYFLSATSPVTSSPTANFPNSQFPQEKSPQSLISPTATSPKKFAHAVKTATLFQWTNAQFEDKKWTFQITYKEIFCNFCYLFNCHSTRPRCSLKPQPLEPQIMWNTRESILYNI